MQQKRQQRPLPPPLPEWFPRGVALLRDPTLNKGTAFTDHERDALGLRGLLPPHVCTQQDQVARVLENFHRLQTPLAKYILLEPAGSQRGAVLPRGHGEPGRDDADHLHADGRPGVPAVRSHLPPAARSVRLGRGPRPHRAGHAQLAASRGVDDRRHRRRAHPRPRRPRRERHGHPDRQALAVHRLRRTAPAAAACR